VDAKHNLVPVTRCERKPVSFRAPGPPDACCAVADRSGSERSDTQESASEAVSQLGQPLPALTG
jgi:hypothetical protein